MGIKALQNLSILFIDTQCELTNIAVRLFSVYMLFIPTAVTVMKQNFVSVDQRHASVKLEKYFHQGEK